MPAEVTEKFEGRTAEMRKSEWLASEDVDGKGEVEVTIEGVFLHKNVPMDAGRKEPKLFALKFVGGARQMILNATNRKTLVAMFGTEVKDWAGKKVKLYVKDGVRNPSGGTTKGLRIKSI